MKKSKLLNLESMNTFIFSMLFGNYEYNMYVITAKSFKSACEKLVTRNPCALIKDFNYSPRLDIDVTNHIKYEDQHLFEEELKKFDNYSDEKIREEKLMWLKNNYNKLLPHVDNTFIGISNDTFMRTCQEWYDWVDCSKLPKDYWFTDGHQG